MDSFSASSAATDQVSITFCLCYNALLSSLVSLYPLLVPFKFIFQPAARVSINSDHTLLIYEPPMVSHFPKNKITNLWTLPASPHTILTLFPRLPNPVFFQFLVLTGCSHWLYPLHFPLHSSPLPPQTHRASEWQRQDSHSVWLQRPPIPSPLYCAIHLWRGLQSSFPHCPTFSSPTQPRKF